MPPVRTNHEGVTVSVGFADGSARQFDDAARKLTIVADLANPFSIMQAMDGVFEHADTLAH
jgi:hypothetical protein